MIRKDFDNNSYLVNNNALYRKHTEHISTTEPLYLDGMSGSDNIVHEPEDPMIVRYVTTEDNLTIYLWSNPACIKSIVVDGCDADIKNPDGSTKSNHQYTFAEAGEHIVEIKLNGNSIPGGTFGANVAVAVIPNGVTNIMPGAFYGNTTLKEVVIPSSVTEIGANNGSAFGGCTNLESITIQNAAVDLPVNCFAGCYNLKYVDLGNSVAAIGSSAFGGCFSLESLTIPKSATIIAPPCGGCTNLKTLIIHGKIDTGGTFSGVTSIENLVIDGNATVITSGSFSDCVNLTSLTLGKDVKEILSGAFGVTQGRTTKHIDVKYNSTIEDFNKIKLSPGWDLNGIGIDVVHCTDGDYTIPFFTKYTFDNGAWVINHAGSGTYTPPGGNSNPSFASYTVGIEFGELCTGIASGAFDSTTWPNIKDVKLSNTITNIGTFLNGNQYVKSITIPESVINVTADYYLISGTKIERVVINSASFAGKRNIFGTSNYYLKEVIFGEKVTTIGAYSFSGCYALTSVTFLGPVTKIDNGAFTSCQNLLHINIPDTVTDIGESAFSGCKELSDVKLPNSLHHIGQYAFLGCESFTSITIPESVDYIGGNAFINCLNVKELYYYALVVYNSSYMSGGSDADLEIIVFGDKVPSINRIDGYTNLKTVSLGKLITTIPDNCFNQLAKLESVTFNGPVINIGSNAFYGCTNLQEINIPDTVTTIGGFAFRGAGLTRISIPESVNSVLELAFYNCNLLTEVSILNPNTTFNTLVFSSCNNLQYINLPKSLKSIGGDMFSSCTSLESIVLPNGVETIGYSAFYNCKNLKLVVIPESVTAIGNNAFYNCSALTSITVKATTPPSLAAGSVFPNALYRVYVPTESVDAYKTEWGQYGLTNKIYPIPE